MRDQPAVARLFHVDFVDVVRRKIARDAGEQINVAFADGLRERRAVANRAVEVIHAFRPCAAGLCTARQLPYKFAQQWRGDEIMPGEFANKVVVITGGSRGIGRAIAASFAREGAQTALAASSQANLD